MDTERIRAILDRACDLLEAGTLAETLEQLEPIDDTYMDAEDRIECAVLGARALTELGNAIDAVDRLEPLLDEHPDSVSLHAELGVALSEAGDLDAAREVLETATSLDDDDDVAFANLALVYEKLHEFELAIGAYDRALKAGADITWVLPRRAAVQSDLGDYAGAGATLKRYLSLAPEDASQWIALAILCSDERRYEEAYAHYANAERLEVDSPWLRLNWGVSAVHAGDLKLAREQLSRLEELGASASQPAILRAFVLEEEGSLDETAACYDEALERSRGEHHNDLVYALEMAMDFFTRHGKPERYERLLEQAYADNACTVELCEAYREATGTRLQSATWFSLLVEADYRDGLIEVTETESADPSKEDPTAQSATPRFTRFLRNFQIIAANRDDATATVLEFVERMRESGPRIREFVNEEPIENTHTGLYEVEMESLVAPKSPYE